MAGCVRFGSLAPEPPRGAGRLCPEFSKTEHNPSIKPLTRCARSSHYVGLPVHCEYTTEPTFLSIIGKNALSRWVWGAANVYICRVSSAGEEKLAQAQWDDRCPERLIVAAEAWRLLAAQLKPS
jgi:hypothetical protein